MINISEDLRRIALIVILLRAGFRIDKEDLKKVGITALKMSCIPGLIEGLFIALASVRFLDFTFAQGGTLGIIIGLTIGFLLIRIFNRYYMRDTKKVLLILAFSILLK